jgi:hypothetical protein
VADGLVLITRVALLACFNRFREALFASIAYNILAWAQAHELLTAKLIKLTTVLADKERTQSKWFTLMDS